jgi:hypothetical protein
MASLDAEAEAARAGKGASLTLRPNAAEKGRMAWQKATGYGRRSLAETAVGR